MKIDYEQSLKNNMRADAEKAIQLFISGEEGISMSIFPQALNPLLKALESLGIWRQALVLPYKDDKNKPIYIIAKINKSSKVKNIEIEEDN